MYASIFFFFSFLTAHVDLLAELKAMPLSRDTLRIKSRKDELERKLRETDSAIKIFSRERVFIKVDEWLYLMDADDELWAVWKAVYCTCYASTKREFLIDPLTIWQDVCAWCYSCERSAFISNQQQLYEEHKYSIGSSHCMDVSQLSCDVVESLP